MSRRSGDLIGVGFVVAGAIAVLVPALLHGASLGPYESVRDSGILQTAAGRTLAFSDQVKAIIPWQALAWRQVHAGHLPLWNPYNGLGMPLAFNWQSAPFSLPVMLGYLVPLRFAYTVGMLAMLVTAGTGAYVFGRVLGFGVIGATCAGMVFELSGAMAGWLGYPHASVMSWAGWLFAATLLVVRGERRARSIAGFAVVFAAAIYAGQPEIIVLLALPLGLFVLMQLAAVARRVGNLMAVGRPLVDLAIASLIGAGLAAPFALPGTLAARDAVRKVHIGNSALSAHDLLYSVLPSYDGLPVPHSTAFGDSLFVTESSMFVGVVAIALAVVALVAYRRRLEIVALGVGLVCITTIAFSTYGAKFMTTLPVVGTVAWARLLLPIGFLIAMLAGAGADALATTTGARREWETAAVAFGIAAVGLLALFLIGRGDLPAHFASIRMRSFIWPAVETIASLMIVGAVIVGVRRNQGAARSWCSPTRAVCALVVLETAFLIASGAVLRGSSPTFFHTPPVVEQMQRAVGDGRVGFAYGGCAQTGVAPNTNIVYGIHELEAYDPMLAKATWRSPYVMTTRTTLLRGLYLYCPRFTSVTAAQLYGVDYLFSSVFNPQVKGTTLVAKLPFFRIYKVPGVSIATLTPLNGASRAPLFATGTPVSLTQPDPATWNMTVVAKAPSVLRMRIPNIAGMHATIDGKPLALRPYANVMLEASVPPGTHAIEFWYLPDSFKVGLGLAALSAVALGALVLGDTRRRRRRDALVLSAS